MPAATPPGERFRRLRVAVRLFQIQASIPERPFSPPPNPQPNHMNTQTLQALQAAATTLTNTAEQLLQLDQHAHDDEAAATVRSQLDRLQGVMFQLQTAVVMTEPRRLAQTETAPEPLRLGGGVVRQLGALVFLLLLLTSCVKKDPEPTNPETSASSTYLEFRVFDADGGDQFNAALNGRVYYFPLSWSETQIQGYFGNPSTNENWNDAPRMPEGEYDIENVVGQYGYNADPGFFHLDFEGGKQIAIVWTFSEANPRARRGYRQQLFIWNGAGENYWLITDRHRAGL